MLSLADILIWYKNNDKDPKFKVVDHIRFSKCKTICAESYAPN